MRGTVAKRLRRLVYGTDLSPKDRKYRWMRRRDKPQWVGYRIADDKRQMYQRLKRGYASIRRNG